MDRFLSLACEDPAIEQVVESGFFLRRSPLNYAWLREDPEDLAVTVNPLMRVLGKDFHELDPIAERIVDVHAGVTIEGLIAANTDTSVTEASDQIRQVVHDECRMGLAGWAKVCFDTEVDLHVSRDEPATTADFEV